MGQAFIGEYSAFLEIYSSYDPKGKGEFRKAVCWKKSIFYIKLIET
jgi:hypothetical protein